MKRTTLNSGVYPSLRARALVVALCSAIAFTSNDGEAAGPDAATQASELDRQARVAFDAGDFELAARRFQAAYAAAPHPATRYNEAWAWEQAGQPGRAADAYEQALVGEGLDDERRSAAKERLAELERNLAILSIRQPAGGTVSVAHLQDARIPLRVHVSPGSHEVRLREQTGTSTVRKVEAQAGRVTELLLEVESHPRELAPAVSAAPAPQQETTGSSSKTWGWVAIAGAGALSLGAGYLGLRTLDALQEYEDTGYRDAAARDRTNRFKLWTNIAWGAAAVSGAVGVVILVSGNPRNQGGAKSSARLQLAPGEVVFNCRF